MNTQQIKQKSDQFLLYDKTKLNNIFPDIT